jgi:hypothetical protein
MSKKHKNKEYQDVSLVGALEHFYFSIYGMSSFPLTHIFRGVGHPTRSKLEKTQ